MTTTPLTPLYAKDLQRAYDGSFYTIAGAGGDLQEWIDGYTQALEAAGLPAPTEWFTTTGESVNAYAGDIPDPARDQFQPDLPFLLFPLDGMPGGQIAMFKLQCQDRWFDDVIDNMRAVY
jgi:hypothetical protein